MRNSKQNGGAVLSQSAQPDSEKPPKIYFSLPQYPRSLKKSSTQQIKNSWNGVLSPLAKQIYQ